MTNEIPLKNAKEIIRDLKAKYYATTEDPIEVSGITIYREGIGNLMTDHGVNVWKVYEEIIEIELDLQRQRTRLKDKVINKEKPFLKE